MGITAQSSHGMAIRCSTAIGLMLGALFVLASGNRADATFPGKNGKIVFNGPCESFCIKIMNADGSHQKNLTTTDRFNEHPKVSPDGKHIVFEADDRITTMDIDGSHVKTLKHKSFDEGDPAWTQDGRYIVFARDDNGELYLMKRGGKIVRRLTKDNAYDAEPDVSSSGLIAWKSDRDGTAGGHDIWVMNLKGKGAHDVSNNAGGEGAPSWSPNGKVIAYTCDGDICKIKKDGTGSDNLTEGFGGTSSDDPAFSPNGDMIAFENQSTGHGEVWVMSSSGGPPDQLTNDGLDSDGNPSWQAK